MDDLNEECTCNGNCDICQGAVGYDTQLVCPDCIIHGWTTVAKARRQEHLAR